MHREQLETRQNKPAQYLEIQWNVESKIFEYVDVFCELKEKLPERHFGSKEFIQFSPNLHKHRVEHLRCQPPGIGVVARAMVAVGEGDAGR